MINAGAGKNEHPSQSLLDLMTIKQHFKKFQDLNVLIVGDIISSRVAKSNLRAFKKLGINAMLSGPDEWMPREEEFKNFPRVELNQGLKNCDVVILLRIQKERHETFDLNEKEYHQKFGLNLNNVKFLNKNSIIMHPAPINHNIEIASELIEHSQSRIFKQMENGVWTRMSIFEWLTKD